MEKFARKIVHTEADFRNGHCDQSDIGQSLWDKVPESQNENFFTFDRAHILTRLEKKIQEEYKKAGLMGKRADNLPGPFRRLAADRIKTTVSQSITKNREKPVDVGVEDARERLKI